jgi:hypothetical protein
VNGCWSYAVPTSVFKQRIKIERTWAGFLFDIISRLPDPDRQKGKLIKGARFWGLIYVWCSTAPEEFNPILTKIIRKPVRISDHTLAGIYKFLKEDPGKTTV